MNYAETSYERDYARTDRDDDSDYRCPHCHEMNGGHVCGDCKALREKQEADVESGLIAAKDIAQLALDARWDEDTTPARKKLANDLRTEMAAAFLLATGERL